MSWGSALEYHFPAFVASFGTYVDYPVGLLDDIEFMLDDDDCVTLIDQTKL